MILATIRFIISSLFFIPIIVVEYSRGGSPKLRNLLEFAFLGFMSISIYFPLQYIGVQYAGAGVSALLVNGSIPILTGLSSALLIRERYGVQQVFGTLLGLVGVGLITLPGLLLERVDWFFYVGVVCLFLNAICFAAYSTISRKLMKRSGKPLLTTSYIIVLGTLILIPMSVSSDWSTVKYLRLDQWLSVIYLAVCCSCGGYFLWNYSLSKMEAAKVAVWQYLEPLVAFVGEAVIFSTVPTATTMTGGAAIIAGALLTSRSEV
jgi:drug/metabolite transporter (DMT)-like permease